MILKNKFQNADDGELFEENETSRLIAKNDIISQDSENVKVKESL